MCNKRGYAAAAAVAAVLVCGLPETAAAESGTGHVSAAELLPATIVAYAEIPQPRQFLADLFDHPLREQVEALPAYQAFIAGPEALPLRFGLGIVQLKLGRPWQEAIETLTAGGVAIALDAESEGAVLLIRCEDESLLVKTRDTLLDFARSEAEKNGEEFATQPQSYRGVDAYPLREGGMAVAGPWLVATNRGELGKAVIDRYVDRDLSSLAEQPQFISARRRRSAAEHAGAQSPSQLLQHPSGDIDAWAYLDLTALRQANVAAELFRGQAKDFGAELVFGGVLAALEHTPYATATARLDETGLRLSAAVPFDSAWVHEARSYYFADGKTAPPPPANIDGALLTLQFHRDIGQLWQRAADLFEDENTLAGLAKAESDISTLLGGNSFSRDVLGALGPYYQIVVSPEAKIEKDLPPPAIRLPAFAIVAQVKEPERTRRLLKVAFQSVVTFVNFESGQNGYPPLELDMQQVGEATLVTATYLAPLSEARDQTAARDQTTGAAVPIQYNFSPTLAFSGNRIVVSSTRQLAVDIATSLAALSDTTVESDPAISSANILLKLHGEGLHKVLANNREHLIARSMLDKGHDREAATAEIDLVLELVSWLHEAAIDFGVQDNQLRLQLDVGVR